MIDRVLVLLLAGCALFGSVIVVELWWDDAGASAGVPVAIRPQPSSLPRAQGPHVDDLLATIFGRPLFSPTRQPGARASSDQPTGLGLTDVRLTGIVIEPGRHLAIFAVPGAKPMVRSEGETMNDWRVDSITPGEVVLSGAAGKRTLQPKIDASLVRPAAAPPRPPQNPPSPATLTPAARSRGLGIPAPTRPGAASPKPASLPAIQPPGTPMPPRRLPGAARERR